MQVVTEVLNKSHHSLQMGNCPIPIAEHPGHQISSLSKSVTAKYFETEVSSKIFDVALALAQF